MSIDNYIAELQEIKTLAADLEKALETKVEVWFASYCCGIHVMDANNEECRYSFDFDNAENLKEHLNVLLIGAMLANGMEV